MRLLLPIVCLLFTHFCSSAQVSISTTGTSPDPSSMLDIIGTGKGVLIPRMTEMQRNAIPLPANALLIYQTDNIPGFYYNAGTTIAPVWVFMSGMSGDPHQEDRIPIDSLPFNITNPGSYYATDNLSGAVGIEISSANVTLDLNGYALIGTPDNTSEGIEVTIAATNIVIRNGSVISWGKEGIKASLASNSSFTQLQILSNNYDGIATGNHNLGSFLVASSNGFDGIDFGEGAVIYNCTANNNLNDGIEADAGSSIIQCSGRDNVQHGIRTTGATTISLNTCSGNNGHGFSCGAGSGLSQNTSSNNGQCGFYLFNSCLAADNVARSNGNHGFEWTNDCVLENNAASLNTLSGFNTTFTGGKLDNNTSSANVQHGFNIQNAGGCLITRNTSKGNGINNYNVLAGNLFATVVTSATINTNTNPFANFQL